MTTTLAVGAVAVRALLGAVRRPAAGYRVSFLLITLVLTFLLVPAPRRARRHHRAGLALSAATVRRSAGRCSTSASSSIARPIRGRRMSCSATIAVLLVLEAARRSVGWILPVTAAAFLAYAMAGPWFDRIGLPLLAHRGYPLDRLIGTLYITLEGIFGVPLDVAATYIILFTIYGAVLEIWGPGRFSSTGPWQ